LNSIGGVDSKQQDIFLEVNPRRGSVTSLRTGVVFVQEVPESAKLLFDKGLKAYRKKEISIRTEINSTKTRLSEKCPQKLLKLMKKHFTSFFNLVVVQNKLNKLNDAIISLEKADEIDPNSININLLMGIIQRKLENSGEAQTRLLRAKNLSNNKQADVNWLVLRSEDSSFFGFPFGTADDIASLGNYDGDGKTDAAVFRPPTWFINGSTSGTQIVGFGATGDVPLPSVYSQE